MAVPAPQQGYVFGGTLRFPEGEAKVYRAVQFENNDGSLMWQVEVPRSGLPKEIVERVDERSSGHWWYSLVCVVPVGDPAFTPGEIARAT